MTQALLLLLLAAHVLAAVYWVGGMALFRGVALYVHVMQLLGIIMMLLYGHLFFAPWRRFRTAVDQGALPDAAKHLNAIRQIVAINLTLGVITILVGATGRYW